LLCSSRGPVEVAADALDGAGGGSEGGGVVFKMTPSGTLTVLYNFTGGGDGKNEIGGLMQATDGNFYGTNNLGGASSWGVLFRITPSGIFTVLHSFEWNTGASAQTALLQHTNGILYGDTAVGGTGSGGDGTFYSFDVGLGPFVTFLPGNRRVGAIVEVLGQGLTGTSAVSLNGAAAKFSVISDTYLTAIIPLWRDQRLDHRDYAKRYAYQQQEIPDQAVDISFNQRASPLGLLASYSGFIPIRLIISFCSAVHVPDSCMSSFFFAYMSFVVWNSFTLPDALRVPTRRRLCHGT